MSHWCHTCNTLDGLGLCEGCDPNGENKKAEEESKRRLKELEESGGTGWPEDGW